MEYSGLLKQYLINRGTYVDKKMEPLATKSDLENFNEMWMFPGLRVTVLQDEDGEMRDYRCKLVDGKKIWVPIDDVNKEEFDEKIANLETLNVEIETRIDSLEDIMSIQGEDVESKK